MASESPLDQARTTLEKWVETRQLISKTRGDWQSDKETLAQSIELFDRELKAVEDSIAKLATGNSQADKEKAEATVTLKGAQETIEQARVFGADFQTKLTILIPKLPAPLQEMLKPHMNKLPATGAATKLGAPECLQVIVGIMNEVDKFNNAISLFSEKQKNTKQEEVAVQSVYVGLGAGYFVNEVGDFAGVAIPGGNGWDWKVQPELAEAVQDIIKMYRNEQSARFVPLPAIIR